MTGSVTLTGSLNIRNIATTSTFTALGRSGSLYIDFVGLGLNYIDGNALFIRNSAGTTNLLTVSGSRFIVSTPTELSGSLSMRRADGDRSLFISSSVSSSTSTAVVGTTASFDSTIGFTPGGTNTTVWDTDLDIYYSGESGSGHTNLSPVSNQVADNAAYSTFNIVLNDGAGTGITLTPGGSIPQDKYTIWINSSGSINKLFENQFINEALSSIEREEYSNILKALIDRKRTELANEKDEWSKKQKLIRFLSSKGFEYNEIIPLLNYD